MLLRIGVAVNASSTKCPKDDFIIIEGLLLVLQLLFCGDDTIDGPDDVDPTAQSPVQGKSGKPGTPLIGVDAGVFVVVIVLMLL
mmetsp:Transcript_4600/g.11696  ORF Transcript_4600/g.11696 Transcript_4600/m.11696 type:complete len:84 (+) Transcript_4600:1830-2081(+)